MNVQPRPNVTFSTGNMSGNNNNNVDDDLTCRVCFDLSDPRYWVRLSNHHHSLLKHPGSSLLPSQVCLTASGSAVIAAESVLSVPSFLLEPEPLLRERLETAVEEAVRGCVRAIRADEGLQSLFDEQLAVILQVCSQQHLVFPNYFYLLIILKLIVEFQIFIIVWYSLLLVIRKYVM